MLTLHQRSSEAWLALAAKKSRPRTSGTRKSEAADASGRANPSSRPASPRASASSRSSEMNAKERASADTLLGQLCSRGVGAAHVVSADLVRDAHGKEDGPGGERQRSSPYCAP